MNFTPERISELRELASKATPRPWGFYNGYPRVDDPNFHNFESLGTDDVAVIEARETSLYTQVDMTIKKADADYLHEATNTLPAALDEIERLRKALETYADYHNWEIQPSGYPDLWHGKDAGPDVAEKALEDNA